MTHRILAAAVIAFAARTAAAQQSPTQSGKPVPQKSAATAQKGVTLAQKGGLSARPGSKLDIAPPASDTAGPPPSIMREAYAYTGDGRRDPFVSLLTTTELRPAISDLRLTTIAFDQSGAHSLAILRDLGTNAQYRVTEGSALGRMHVSAIRAKTVVFTIDEFGTTRRDSLVLGDSTKVRAK